jgi:hypothetical protein
VQQILQPLAAPPAPGGQPGYLFDERAHRAFARRQLNLRTHRTSHTGRPPIGVSFRRRWYRLRAEVDTVAQPGHEADSARTRAYSQVASTLDSSRSTTTPAR